MTGFIQNSPKRVEGTLSILSHLLPDGYFAAVFARPHSISPGIPDDDHCLVKIGAFFYENGLNARSNIFCW